MRPCISEEDYRRIRTVLNELSPTKRTPEIGQLIREMEKAERLPEEEMPTGIIRLESYFEVQDLQTGKEHCFTLSLPNRASLTDKRISVLSPLGVALIGFSEGMKVEWDLPGGQRILHIRKVENQVS